LSLTQGRALRVALVTSSYNYIPDGVALTLNRLVGYLERQGVEVLVFTPIADRPALRIRARSCRCLPSPCPDARNTAWRWAWPVT
jgi:hypothetical protein